MQKICRALISNVKCKLDLKEGQSKPLGVFALVDAVLMFVKDKEFTLPRTIQ